jgi:hypothetical protein
MPADSDFADVVSGLLADRERREELTEAGLHRSLQYSLARMLDGYEGLLFELAEVHADSVAPV